MLVVTHEMGFARKAGSRVLFMADGTDPRRSSPGRVLHTSYDCKSDGFPVENTFTLRG